MDDQFKPDFDIPYFITFSTVGWVDVFVRKEYIKIILDSLHFCQNNKGLMVHAWCVMSNHVYLIIRKKGNYEITEIIEYFYHDTSTKIIDAIRLNPNENRRDWMFRIFDRYAQKYNKSIVEIFWQNEYCPVQLSDNEITMEKLHFIHWAPVKGGFSDRTFNYRYSSAIDYETTRKGLLQITPLKIVHNT